MLLITNGKIVTRDADNTFFDKGSLVFDGERVIDIGPSESIDAKYPQAQAIDARGRLVMPGFINCHTHYYSTFARGMPSLSSRPNTTFAEILTNLWWRLDKALTLDDVYWSCAGPMIDGVRSGVTSVIDHHASPRAVTGSLFKIAEAAALFGIRSNLCYEVSDRDGMEIAKEGVRENGEFARHCAAGDSDMLRSLVGVHAPMTVSEETLDACVETAKTAETGLHIHVSEGIEDVADSIAKYKVRPVERLAGRKALGEMSLAVHCVNVTDEEQEILAASKTPVVNNPQSNMGNAVGCSPALDMMKKGVLLGLGTDGYTADMTESYKTFPLIQRHQKRLPSAAWAESAVTFFENNRTIFNRHLKHGKVGSLEKNAYADIIIVDYNPPTEITKDNINGHLLFGVSGRHVDTVIINGRVVMCEREISGIDEGRLLARSREQAAALWKRLL